MEKNGMKRRAAFDVLEKIETEKNRRGWNDYQLAQRAGISQSVLSTWKKRSIEPGLASIEQICRAFGITLSEFFRNDRDSTELTPDQEDLLREWNRLSDEQKKAVLTLIRNLR